jgi:CRP-like cAMP-binding protein
MIRRCCNMTRVRTLKTFPLFSACSVRDLSRIDSLTCDLHVEAGRVLTLADHPGYEFFIVMNGTATVWCHGVELDRLRPGSFFGELALLSGQNRVATVVADADMDLLVMSVQEFRSPHFQIEPVKDVMLATVAERLCRTSEGWAHAVAEPAASLLPLLPDSSAAGFSGAAQSREYEDRALRLWRDGVHLMNRL